MQSRSLRCSEEIQPGITEPPNPAHGPWRRLSAQANEADIRVVPEPGMVLILVAGIVLLAVLTRHRCIRPLEKGIRQL
jgi:hypothetical protein